MAATAPPAGGPDSSTAPPGSTVTLLPHGRSGRKLRTVAISSQLGLRCGSAGSWQCPSTSRPTEPSGASTRQPAAVGSAAPVGGGEPRLRGGGGGKRHDTIPSARGKSRTTPYCRSVPTYSGPP